MELKRIQYEKVHGHLTDQLSFTQGENFLVGINGCGKTTVLNLIRWILSPSLPDLCILEHDLIVLEVIHDNIQYTISSAIKENSHELNVTTKENLRDFKPIITALRIDPKLLHRNPHLKDIRAAYQNLTPEPHEVETWSFLQDELPSPVFVGLERNVTDERVSNSKKISRMSEIRNPHLVATDLMRDAFNSSRRRLVEINDVLNRRVLELSFSGILKPGTKLEGQSPKNVLDKINQLKQRFIKSSAQGVYSKALSAEEVRSAVVKYLEELGSLLTNKSTKDDEVTIALNQHNFDRASNMFDLFEQHETQANSVQADVNTFIETINSFLADSRKSLYFNENTGIPYFKSEAFHENLSLSELSSGEAQIVVLLSYFAFLAKTGIPIVIDEPELSLHVEWQKQFVTAVKKIMPEECQTIMATHSPEICGASDVNVQAISIRGKK